MSDILTTLRQVRSQREAMRDFISAQLKETGRTPIESYRLMHAFIETLEALEAGERERARPLMRKWEYLARAMLDRQLFDAPDAMAISMVDGSVVHGVDATTLKLSEMIQAQRQLLTEA